MTAAGFVGRVGGLAAALGVGVAIGLAASAPASAAPSESTSRSGTTSDAAPSPRRSAAGSGSGSEAAPTAGLARSATAALKAPGGSAPRRAAAVGARPGQSERVIPPAATVLVAAAPQVPPSPAPGLEAAAARSTWRAARRTITATPAAAVPVAGTTASAGSAPAPGPGPIARALRALFDCDPRGRLITIYKGTHFAIPNNFGGLFVQRVAGTGTFTSDSVYDLQDEDQYDWSKFTGIAFTPLEPDRNSVMVGWRYDLTTQEFEIAPFYNVDKVRILPQDPAEVISVPAGETFDYVVDYTGVTLTYGDRTVFKPFPEGLAPNVWTAVRVSGWFGGNEVAPRTLSYYIKFT